MEEEIATIIVRVLDAFQNSIPTAAELKEWSHSQEANQNLEDKSSFEDEEFDEIERDVREIVSKFRRMTQDEIDVMLVGMNDAQREDIQRKAENAEHAVNCKEIGNANGD